jgi:hypothetical protein
MLDFFSGWRPSHVIGLVAVISTFLTIMVVAVGAFWYCHRRAVLIAEQKHDFLERGFTVDQIERLLRAPAPSAQEAAASEKAVEGNLASLLVQYEVPAPSIEQIMKMFQSVEPASKQAVCDSISEMLESEAADEQLLTAVRQLCRPSENPQPRQVGIA